VNNFKKRGREMLQKSDVVWSQCLETIKEHITDQTFTTWFQPIVPIKLEDSTLTVQLPSQFFFEYLESHYQNLIHEALRNTLGEDSKLNYSIMVAETNELLKFPSQKKRTPLINTENNNTNHTLSPRYTFENFVEGNNNQFARAAAMAVAHAPGKTTFNPLVIYGGVGLGKTHLIQAIGNYVQAEGVFKRIAYVSSDKFTIEFIDSIQRNRTTEFSNHYHNVDILIVDDIHFFITKERTQEVFFHTFNTLHQNGKQIILSSDRPPKELKGMEERLISRFQWGLVVDIQPPDLETRIAILQRKAEENGIVIPTGIIELFATNITSNIRELEGSLIRLLACSSLEGKDITVELAKSVLKELCLNKNKHSLTVEAIQKIVCEHYQIPDDMIRAKTRKQEIALARQISMFLAKKYTSYSLKTIGLHFGGRDHSTVIHAIQTIEEYLHTNTHIKDDVDQLERKIDIASV
jgi:chromosomal replication initiator protein